MADVIQLSQSTTPIVENSLMETLWFYLSTYWWVGVIILAVFLLVAYVVWRILEGIKLNENALYFLFVQRKKLCRQQKDAKRYNSFFKPEKNDPINCQYLENGNLIKKTIGHYYGDFYSNEGNHNLAYFKRGERRFLFFPVVSILLLNKKSNVTLEYDKVDPKTKVKTTETITQNLPTDIAYFSNSEIILMGCKSVDKLEVEGFFLVPVLAEQDNKQIDMSSYSYQQLSEVIKGEQLSHNLNYFVQANKKALEINPMIRTVKQVGDSNNNVEDS